MVPWIYFLGCEFNGRGYANQVMNGRTPEKCLSTSPEAYAVVDCKSLYDLIQKTTIPQCQEYRTTLEALIIKDRMKEGVKIKWVHSAAQLADRFDKTYGLFSVA